MLGPTLVKMGSADGGNRWRKSWKWDWVQVRPHHIYRQVRYLMLAQRSHPSSISDRDICKCLEVSIALFFEALPFDTRSYLTLSPEPVVDGPEYSGGQWLLNSTSHHVPLEGM